MVAINPERVKVIKLSKEEQLAILQFCPHLEPEVSYRIANCTDGFVQLPDYEVYKLRAIIDEQISRINSEKARKTLCTVSNKLCPNPILASIAEHLTGKDFKDLDEAQREVDKIHERHNTTPDPEMAGLTPNQVSRLIHLPWDSDGFPIRFNKQVSTDDVQGSYFYKNSRILLNTLIELEDENTATATGNLSRNVLKMLFDSIIHREADRTFFSEFNGSFNEHNAYTVHETRIACQMANLIRKKGRRFLVTKKHRELLLDENAGRLYYLLFTTFFKRFNIAYRDGFPELYSIQFTIPFGLYVIDKFAGDFCSIENLEKRIFLPAVRKEITNHCNKDWTLKGLIHTRIIEPLSSFGLIEVTRGSKEAVFDVEAVRKTELFAKFMRFSL